MVNILGDQPILMVVQHNLDVRLHLTHAGELDSYTEVEGDTAWHTVMQRRMKYVEENRMWELVDLLDDHHPNTLKWVFRLQKSEAGEVIKRKERLVQTSLSSRWESTTMMPSCPSCTWS